jgi:hypothetical protein
MRSSSGVRKMRLASRPATEIVAVMLKAHPAIRVEEKPGIVSAAIGEAWGSPLK